VLPGPEEPSPLVDPNLLLSDKNSPLIKLYKISATFLLLFVFLYRLTMKTNA
jgi:hypothetical protein